MHLAKRGVNEMRYSTATLSTYFQRWGSYLSSPHRSPLPHYTSSALTGALRPSFPRGEEKSRGDRFSALSCLNSAKHVHKKPAACFHNAAGGLIVSFFLGDAHCRKETAINYSIGWQTVSAFVDSY